MNPKRVIIVGTVAIAITISAGIFGNDASANTLSISIVKSDSNDNTKENNPSSEAVRANAKADITQVLGLASDAELYEALYTGNSLADIAEKNQVPLQRVIQLQVAELTKQLDARLASGSISPITYELQKSELPELITKSVHAGMKA